MKLLVTGGAGNLGRYLVSHLSGPELEVVGYTYHSADLPADSPHRALMPAGARGFKVDLGTGEGLAECLAATAPDVVVNAAALPNPRVCEADPAAARKVNVPAALVAALAALEAPPVLVHISTDFVYDGRSSELYVAGASEAQPINVYGQSKLESEQLLQARYPNHVSLRSSMIFGPVPPACKSSHFTHFVDSVMADKQAVDFFHDEFRSPVFVGDFVTAIHAIAAKCAAAQRGPASDAATSDAAPTPTSNGEATPSTAPALAPALAPAPALSTAPAVTTTGSAVDRAQLRHTYNFGGPERLSRVQMAQAVCKHRGYDAALIKVASVDSVDRGVPTPRDTGMNSSQIEADLGFKLTTFAQGLALTFPPA